MSEEDKKEQITEANETKTQSSSAAPTPIVINTAPANVGKTALKIILVAVILVIGWAVSLFVVYHKHEKAIAKKDAAMKELESANLELEKALARVETDLDFLEKKQQKATELVESTSVVIDELKVAASTTGNTIKDIKANQEKIKKAVLDLIEDYNRILAAFQESNDATTD